MAIQNRSTMHQKESCYCTGYSLYYGKNGCCTKDRSSNKDLIISMAHPAKMNAHLSLPARAAVSNQSHMLAALLRPVLPTRKSRPAQPLFFPNPRPHHDNVPAHLLHNLCPAKQPKKTVTMPNSTHYLHSISHLRRAPIPHSRMNTPPKGQ